MAISLQKKLKDEGWYLTDDGLKKVSDDGKISDIQGLVRKALDMDLKEISSGGLPTDFAKSSKLEVPSTGYIVQIQRIHNLSAPKCNQESKTSPRMLLLELTDGTTSCSAIELDHLPTLSVNTPPGTKILLRGTIKIVQGMLVLTPSTMKNCNGVVTAMVEKWEHEKAMSKYAKGVKPNAGSVPPPWTPFGQKSQQTLVNEFKSLAIEKKNEEPKEKDIEFVTNRNEAIAEILKTKQKKIFGGGNRQLVDHNVKKIMEKGYTEEQAKTSLKFARNNLEKAMGNLKRREERNSGETTSTRGPFNKTQKEDRFGRKGRIEETESAKPSNKVSLFDFLEDKIKIPKGTETTPAYSQSTTNNKTGAKSSDESYPKQHYRSDDYQPSNRTSTNRNIQSINNGSNPPSQSQIDNRSKFENNISASFASRQKKDDDQYPPSRNYNDSKANKWSGKPNMTNPRQSTHETSSGSYNKGANARPQSSNYPQNSYQNNAPANSAYGQRFSKNFNETGKPSRYDEKHQHPRSEQNDRRNNAPYNVNQLTEATASMKLSNNKRPPYNSQPNYSGKHQQTPSQPSSRPQSQNHPSKNAPTPNGYDYNPYKIMGFQNKETNEYALNVLKNQNFDALPPTVLAKQPSQPMPAENFVPANRNFVVPPPPTATAVMAQPFIPAVINTQPFNWTWKEHDICFAKYWEDQRYYNAEITAVTNKTCVVQFMEYGNYEEVLLSDCLPINDANIQSINQYNNNLILDQNVQYYQQQQQQQQHRPIYVTPAQRGAK